MVGSLFISINCHKCEKFACRHVRENWLPEVAHPLCYRNQLPLRFASSTASGWSELSEDFLCRFSEGSMGMKGFSYLWTAFQNVYYWALIVGLNRLHIWLQLELVHLTVSKSRLLNYFLHFQTIFDYLLFLTHLSLTEPNILKL